MNTSLPPIWTRPDAGASEAPPAAPVPPGTAPASAASLLVGRGSHGRGYSRRIVFGLIALAGISAAVVNLVVYHSERSALVARRWDQLGRWADARRDVVRDRVWQLRRQAGYAAAHPLLVRWASRASAGTLSAQERMELQTELERIVSTLDLHHVELVAPRGLRLEASRAAPGRIAPASLAAVERAREGGEPVVGLLPAGSDHAALIQVASPVPISGPAATRPVLVSTGLADEVLAPLLAKDQVVPGAAGRAFLVRLEGEQLDYLPSPVPGAPVPAPARLSDRTARAAGIAASGVESNVEVSWPDGDTQWAATRFLPELGWGLVAEVGRSALLVELRYTLVRLLLLDLLVGLGAVGLAWVWRRQYRRGMARHEVRLVHRHAARVQAVLDTAFDAILTFGQDGRIHTVNRAAERMFGRAAPDIVGQPLHRLLRWGATAATPGHQPLPTPGVVCTADLRKADGETLPVEFSLGQAGEGDDLLYTAIVRDISGRVEAERRIRQFAEGLETSNRRLEELNAQLQEASRLKSEFLANTSHELRTPLNGMIGFLQLVLDGLCESPEEEREFLRQGLQCSRHLLGLINDVLDIAKIEAGKLHVEIERVSVSDLFADVEMVTHVQAKQAGVALCFETPPGSEVTVRCDFAKTKQVLINLIGNSLKFTPRGSIHIRAHAYPGLGHVMFEVVDTGIGIPAAQQKRIFDKFTQGDGSTTRRYGGTGLGLAISRSLVELMGGIIGVQSEGEGRGTRMYFSLPTWEEAGVGLVDDSDPDGETIAGPAKGPLVLVVEDDPAFRRFLAASLRSCGYRTVTSSHAEGAWLLVRRLEPAVVVLDYALSCAEGAALRTGWDLAQRMTAHPETRHIPLIFVTGFDEELREKLKSTAFARRPEHLVKPVEGGVLAAKIEELVRDPQGPVVRVLLADDDPKVVAYVRKVLPGNRFHIDVANNGEECLHVLRTQPSGFDLLLLDLMMPEVSGYDVLREMALRGTAAELPVVVLTNFPDVRDPEEKRLLETGLVLEVLPKSAVHDNPVLLSHVIDWHLQAALEQGGEELREAA